MSDESALAPQGLYAIILAAGASSRFGSPKQLARIADQPLLSAVIGRVVENVGQGALVVLGANAAQLTPMLQHSPVSVVINRGWREGLASSIRAGIARLPSSCAGAMLVLADQAAVTAEDLGRLAGAWRRQPHSIAAAQYGATIGVAAIFPSFLFSDLSQLRGDVGARTLLKHHTERVVRVPMESAAFDLDTPEDFLAIEVWRKAWPGS